MYKTHTRTNYNPETGVATVTLVWQGQEFIGKAFCHPDDKDMVNELTGLSIAEGRATIKLLKHYRKNVVKPQIAILEQLWATMEQGKYFDKKSPYVRLVRRQIASLKNTEANLRCDIENIRKSIYDYINDKEEFYKKIRSKREAENK